MTEALRQHSPLFIPSPWRNDFPAMSDKMNGKPLVYLDSGASAQKPRAVIETMADVMGHGYANVHRGLYQYSSELTARFEDVRAIVARFIGARGPETIIFTRNTTESINLVAQSWGNATLQADDEIILTAMEHHANIVPWQLVAERMGAKIKVWPMTKDERLDIADLQPLLCERTRMVAFTHASNVLGTINDVKSITAKIKSFNPDTKILVDGSQAVVHGPINVSDLNVDFYAFTGHKLYGPTGVGVLYGRADVLAAMPPFMGGGDMIDRVSFLGTTYRDAPYRFEAGTPAIAEVIGLGAAIDYMAMIGWPAITAHEAALTAKLRAMLETIPDTTIFGPDAHAARVGLYSFACDWGHPSDIAMILDQQGIAVRTGHHCAMPLHDVLGVPATVRASLGLYNDTHDIECLHAGLMKAREMLS